MTDNIAIKIENLTKVYKLYDSPIDRLKEALHLRNKKYHKNFYALNDVNFEIKKGDTIGIIGKNGSGKSTLLKIITGVLTPSQGSVVANGRISALLELGAGFNPEYTGLENIYFQGTLMGFERHEIELKVAEILSFADIGEFANQPFKTYSSGMAARLAFAVAINVEPDILIVDEALSVGDMFFQLKCYNKFSELQNAGTTILFVTHDIGTIIKYCNSAILINNGHLIETGKPDFVSDCYKKILVYDNKTATKLSKSGDDSSKIVDEGKLNWKDSLVINKDASFYGNGNAEIIDFGVFDLIGNIGMAFLQGDDFDFKFKIKFYEAVENPIFAFGVKDVKGNEIIASNTIIENVVTGSFNKLDEVVVSFRQKNTLKQGSYLISCACTGNVNGEFVVYARAYNIFAFDSLTDRATVGFVQPFSNVKITRC